MKYIVPLMVFIIVLIIVLDLISYKYLDKTSNNLSDMINFVQSDIEKENWSKAEKNIDTMEKEWDKVNKKWAILIEHREIDEIEMNMTRLKSHIDTKNKDLSLAELKSLKMLIKHIPLNEKLSIENIL